ncbi:MAG: tRNA (adenosine(37)-N6)-threonylcarbamoyltransferase complex dimerization subunit type 1 TsaB [Acidobacteriota bacterium]|nr:tRNA (adenosine(37)-N6)-threonylcarbamoyltransferase complex dimerization subunit type 1 TsaB [Acidobacteriota bacterium]
MRVLAIDTATSQVSVAVAVDGEVVGQVALRAGRRHGETLAPAIKALVALSGVELSSIGRIAVDVGPGLFTGLRVGLATAKALGAALDVPVATCTSLDLLAHPLRWEGRPVASVVDARRGEVFWALYQPAQEAMVACSEAVAQSPDEVAVRLSVVPGVLLAGDGARRYFGSGPFELAPPSFDHPSAAALAGWAPDLMAVAAERVVAVYLRGADVRIGWEQR